MSRLVQPFKMARGMKMASAVPTVPCILPLLHAISTKSKLQQIDVANGLPRVAYPRPEMKVSTPLTLQNIRIQPH